MSDCNKCCCDIEFDVIGLYPNFDDGDWYTISDIFNKFIKQYNININEVEVAFNHPSYTELKKYGQHNRLPNIQWMHSLGKSRLNFFTDIMNTSDDYINLFNYIYSTKSIALFLGELNNELQSEYEAYLDTHVPIIHITPDEYIHVKWVGTPDSELQLSNT